MCFKDDRSRASWYRTAAQVEVELRRRVHRTRSGGPALLHFDSPTMVGYQVPSKVFETMYCRKVEETPWECYEYLGIDAGHVNIPISHLEVRRSGVGEHAGRGLFAARDIPADAVLDMNQSVKAFHIMPSTWSVIEDMYGRGDGGDEESKLSSVVTFAVGTWNRTSFYGTSINDSSTKFPNYSFEYYECKDTDTRQRCW